MTRPPSTATRRGRSAKKRAPARRTAHIEYQPTGLDASHRRVREAYHAIADQAVRVGFITRAPGTALCGSLGPWADIPDALFPPVVTCRACRQITAREHITVTGGMP
jgi:hypothetical protein